MYDWDVLISLEFSLQFYTKNETNPCLRNINDLFETLQET